MIELNETEDGLVRIRIAGQIDQSQYQATLPRAEGIITSAASPLSVLVEIAEDAEIEPTVLWDDMQFGEAHAHRIGRMAVVAPPKWEGYVELVRDTGVDAKLFAPGNTTAAKNWAKAEE